jgi:hypothetical protein
MGRTNKPALQHRANRVARPYEGIPLDDRRGASIRLLPYPAGLDDSINQGVDERELRNKDRANATWWRKFRQTMGETN